MISGCIKIIHQPQSKLDINNLILLLALKTNEKNKKIVNTALRTFPITLFQNIQSSCLGTV